MITSFHSRQHLLILSLMIMLGSSGMVFGESTDTMHVDPSELLEAGPVTNEVAPAVQATQPTESKPAKSTSSEPAYPVASWTPMPTPTAVPAVDAKPITATWMSPYYFSAYIPNLDKTEVNLGMILSQNPGIDVAIAWGALNELMAAAKMSVQGASYTAGIRLKYLIRPEHTQETKPGFSAVLGWRVQNHRTNDDEHLTIYRGNRVYTGIVLSKDGGSLARGLSADETLINFLKYFRIHCEAIAEYQTGRINETEDELNRPEFGIRGALEMVIDPKRLYASVNYQSLSDWINEHDTYMGFRYYPRQDFSLDLIGGWFGQQTTINISLAWLF